MGRLVHYTGNDIYDLLKNEILTLSLKPGQMISENEISSRFHVSRTPVHNAFTQLKKDGFVDIVPQKGTIVSLIDLDYIRQILYLRCCVEINIYIEAMDLCDDSFYRMLQNKIEEQRRITDNESEAVKSFYEMTDEFHSAFYDILNKNKLWQTVSNLQK